MKTESESISFASLPLVSVLPKPKMKTAARLLEELEAVIAARESAEEREQEIKLQLEEIQHDAGALGLRYGDLCFIAREKPGRRTLDKGLLIENGVAPEVIEQSMKEGAPYVERRFKRIEG